MTIPRALLIVCAAVFASAAIGQVAGDRLSDYIIGLERAALARWLAADPRGYLDLYASDVSYFGPNVERRADGRSVLENLFSPMNDMDLSRTEPKFDMVSPTVRRFGDLALLTYNLRTYRRPDPQSDHVLVARWNSSELFRLIEGEWKIVHSHWSYTEHSNPASGH